MTWTLSVVKEPWGSLIVDGLITLSFNGTGWVL